ncbi:uncharacterized protein METZ01_LOCUS320652 [marine metagenome]|uniref:Uncharacterized protein n=1 Tax=marine metagenome TaxID=408172 RepID=A0A382P4Y1_9ZZZZ
MKLKSSLLLLPILFWVGCEDKDAAADSSANLEIINILDAMDVQLAANECSDANETFQEFLNFGEPDVVATSVCSSYFELTDDEFERYWVFLDSNGDVTSAEFCDILSGISTTVRTGLENNCFIFTEGDDGDDDGDGDVTVESVSGTYNISSVTVHSGGDCSVDNGTSGVCFPDISVSQSACVETGAGTCWDENSNGIEGIEDEANCTGDNRWVNFGWNPWTNLFPAMSFTFSDDGTYTGKAFEDESGTWTLDGTTITMTDSEDEVRTGTVSGNTITTELIEPIISDADCAVMVFTK